MQRRATIIFIAFVASLLAIGPAAAQEIVGLDQTMKAIDAQRRVDAEFAAGLARVEKAAREEGDRLRHDEATTDSEQSTVADLRRLRSEMRLSAWASTLSSPAMAVATIRRLHS